MSKGYRGVGVTIVELILISTLLGTAGLMIWHISALKTEQKLKAVYRAEQGQRQTEKTLNDVCVGFSGIDAANCLKGAIEAADKANSKEREKDDLSAQEKMADWAFYMVIASFMSVAVTFAGVVYVRRTLIEAQSTSGAAFDAARYAKDQLEFSKKIGRIEAGAYLQISASNIERKAAYLYIGIGLHNIGKSPALNVSTDSANVIRHDGQFGKRSRADKVASESVFIAPNGVETLNLIARIEDINPDDGSWELGNEARETDVFATVSWSDLLSNNQTVSFELRVNQNNTAFKEGFFRFKRTKTTYHKRKD